MEHVLHSSSLMNSPLGVSFSGLDWSSQKLESVVNKPFCVDWDICSAGRYSHDQLVASLQRQTDFLNVKWRGASWIPWFLCILWSLTTLQHIQNTYQWGVGCLRHNHHSITFAKPTFSVCCWNALYLSHLTIKHHIDIITCEIKLINDKYLLWIYFFPSLYLPRGPTIIYLAEHTLSKYIPIPHWASTPLEHHSECLWAFLVFY